LVPQKKKEFERNFKEGMQEELEEEEYRILAPSEMFRLTSLDKDPLLLYRFQVRGTYYFKLVHQWGGDLSKWRAVINYPLRSMKHLIISCMLFWMTFLLALTANIGISPSSTLTLTTFLLIALTIFSVSMFKTDNGNYHTSDKIWDSEEEF
jgi:predicted neutral ceramidase superfamily lipid hydrolase